MLYHEEAGLPGRIGEEPTPFETAPQRAGDPNARGILTLLLVVVAGAVLYFAYQAIQNAINPPASSEFDVTQYCEGYADRRPAGNWDRNFATCVKAF